MQTFFPNRNVLNSLLVNHLKLTLKLNVVLLVTLYKPTCAPVIRNAFYFCNVPPFLLFVVCFLKPLQSAVSDLDGNIKRNTPSVQQFSLDTYLEMTWLFS